LNHAAAHFIHLQETWLWVLVIWIINFSKIWSLSKSLSPFILSLTVIWLLKLLIRCSIIELIEFFFIFNLDILIIIIMPFPILSILKLLILSSLMRILEIFFFFLSIIIQILVFILIVELIIVIKIIFLLFMVIQ